MERDTNQMHLFRLWHVSILQHKFAYQRLVLATKILHHPDRRDPWPSLPRTYPYDSVHILQCFDIPSMVEIEVCQRCQKGPNSNDQHVVSALGNPAIVALILLSHVNCKGTVCLFFIMFCLFMGIPVRIDGNRRQGFG